MFLLRFHLTFLSLLLPYSHSFVSLDLHPLALSSLFKHPVSVFVFLLGLLKKRSLTKTVVLRELNRKLLPKVLFCLRTSSFLIRFTHIFFSSFPFYPGLFQRVVPFISPRYALVSSTVGYVAKNEPCDNRSIDQSNLAKYLPTMSFSSTASCTTIEVTGAEDLLSGVYYVDERTGNYLRFGGVAVYILGKYYTGIWYLGKGSSVGEANDDYPHYYVSQLT